MYVIKTGSFTFIYHNDQVNYSPLINCNLQSAMLTIVLSYYFGVLVISIYSGTIDNIGFVENNF